MVDSWPNTMYATREHPATAAPHPFDALAARYDATFSWRRLGRWLRAAVWERLGTAFQPGNMVLELGCGTGEDALWLARRGVYVHATDASPAMLSVAWRKAQAAGLAEQISFAQLDLADCLTRNLNVETQSSVVYDGAFSNFGAFNCLPSRQPVAEMLANVVRPGGLVVLVLMGPLCPWEIAWYLAHGHARTALRRLRRGAQARLDNSSVVHVWYPTPRRLRAEFDLSFRHLETAAVGALLPPSQLAHLVDRWPRCFGTLALLEQRFGRRFPWTWLNDHYLMVFERR